MLAQSFPYTYKRNDFVKTKDQRELARFGLARNRTFKNDFVKTKDQRELARFGLARTDDKPKERLSLLRLSRGAKEEDEVKSHF